MSYEHPHRGIIDRHRPLCPICGEEMLYALDTEYVQPVFFCNRLHTGPEFDEAIKAMRAADWPEARA